MNAGLPLWVALRAGEDGERSSAPEGALTLEGLAVQATTCSKFNVQLGQIQDLALFDARDMDFDAHLEVCHRTSLDLGEP